MTKAKTAGRGKARAEPLRVAFVGTIKSFKSDLDAVGDKVGKIIISFRPEGQTIAQLDVLQQPDKEVFVVIIPGHRL
jgi:hypothetical protein